MARVFVGLSGGVDSAVSAALLKEQGHEVTGAFIKIWQPEFTECTWREDRLDAMRVAAHLGIPFREIDLSDLYKKEVVSRMVEDYAQGITPNPDVLCNTYVKFGAFLRWALSEGAEAIATGHYARTQMIDLRSRSLLRGADREKDQSYFLWEMGAEALSRTMFPVGELLKRDVRELAKKFSLPNATRRDSQGLCFIGEISLDEFLVRILPLEDGPVVDTGGKRIGTHRGAALYTVGQRHGFEIAGERAPHYVIAVDVGRNTVLVSANRADAAKQSFRVENLQWLTGHLPTKPQHLHAQVRYRDAAHPCTLDASGIVRFDQPVIASAGQSLVAYREDRVVAGGVILGAL